jgi:hypothetical protein
MIEVLTAIGIVTLVLIAAAGIPTALAEFLRACVPVATAIRELHAAFSKPSSQDASHQPPLPRRECKGLRTPAQTTSKLIRTRRIPACVPCRAPDFDIGQPLGCELTRPHGVLVAPQTDQDYSAALVAASLP